MAVYKQSIKNLNLNFLYLIIYINIKYIYIPDMDRGQQGGASQFVLGG